MFLIYRSKSFFGRAVELKLHHIGVFIRLQHQVYAAFTGMIFRFDVEAHQLKDDKEYVLIMKLQIAHQLIRRIGHQRGKTAEEGVDLACFHFVYKLLYLEGRVYFISICIEGHQILEKSLFYFPVGKAQAIHSKTRVVPLDGKVSALIDHGDRVGRLRVDAVQYVCICFLVCHTV